MRGSATIDGDDVVLDSKSAEKYLRDKSEHREQLLPDLVALIEPDARSTVGFVERHGLLRHGPEHLGDDECRESLSDWQAAALNLRMLIELYVCLDDADSMRTFLRRLRDIGRFRGPIPDDNQQCLAYVSGELARDITRGLQGCSWTITAACTLATDGKKVGGPRDFFLGDDSPNLEAAAYAQLATLIANKAPFHDCEGCGTMFTPDHGRQRYCTPQCNARARKARQRAKGA